jgi:hypothetical protein
MNLFEDMFNIKFWVTFQMAVDVVMVFLVIYFLRSLRSGSFRDMTQETGTRIIQMLEPLIRDADSTAKSFEKQLKEKKRLINHLNESLDGRIISLNLLLNRTDALFTSDFRGPVSADRKHVFDQQEAILEQFNKGHDAATAARTLSIPKNEVEMVYDLKQKFLSLEQDVPQTDRS